jgi:hypothetical protein
MNVYKKGNKNKVDRQSTGFDSYQSSVGGNIVESLVSGMTLPVSFIPDID